MKKILGPHYSQYSL